MNSSCRALQQPRLLSRQISWGNPAISLPIHVASNGLPLGVQFVAKKGRENLLLKMGKLFEQNGKFRII